MNKDNSTVTRMRGLIITKISPALQLLTQEGNTAYCNSKVARGKFSFYQLSNNKEERTG